MSEIQATIGVFERLGNLIINKKKLITKKVDQ